ncbi:MAG TPA: MFS transporter [Ilumatobacter sp.]
MAAISDDPAVVRRTQVIDLARSVPLGVILPLETSVLLTIAIKHFDAPGLAKGLIAAASGVGLLGSTVLTAFARRSRRPSMSIASIVIGAGAVGFALAATGSLVLYVVGVIVGLAAISLNLPLLAATYDRNFSAADRGRRVGRGLSVKVAVSAPLSIVMGAWLADHPGLWWVVVLAGAASAATLSVLNRRFPSEPLGAVAGRRAHPWPRFELLREDRRLGVILAAWMFMGFGNLMLLPLRIEFLAQPQYGIEASATTITVLTVAVPSLMRLLTSTFFGRVFDRMSVFSIRIGLNVLFIVYVATFFSGTSPIGLWIGSITLGLAFAGGDLMWMLWVTKFAPPGRVADYMGLHTFLTGLRTVAAPLFAYAVIEQISLGWVAVLGAGLMVVSSLILLPDAVADERSRRHTGR